MAVSDLSEWELPRLRASFIFQVGSGLLDLLAIPHLVTRVQALTLSIRRMTPSILRPTTNQQSKVSGYPLDGRGEYIERTANHPVPDLAEFFDVKFYPYNPPGAPPIFAAMSKKHVC